MPQPYDELQALRADARDEIKRRIEQRDKYSIQLTVALAALLALAFANPSFERALLAAPLVSIYFTVLILYSYRIHSVLAGYVADLEVKLSAEAGISADLEWEHYYRKHAVPGIRRSFFLIALWVVSVFSMGYLWTRYGADHDVLFLPSVVYLGSCVLISLTAGEKKK